METREAAPLQARAELGALVLINCLLIVREPNLQRASMHTEVFLMPVYYHSKEFTVLKSKFTFIWI